jgi:hypothetical protein
MFGGLIQIDLVIFYIFFNHLFFNFMFQHLTWVFFILIFFNFIFKHWVDYELNS